MPKKRRTDLTARDLGQLCPVKSSDAWALRNAHDQALEWVPDRRILPLPKECRLPLRLITRRSGVRQIVPGSNLLDFLRLASAGGLEIQIRLNSVPQELRQTHRMMQLLFAWTSSDRRMLARKFNRIEELYLRPSERRPWGSQSVLPEGLVDERARRWRVPDLLRAGETEALRLGKPRVSLGRRVELGLYAAAGSCEQLTVCNPDQGVSLLKIGLFGIDQGTRPSPSTYQEMEGRFCGTLCWHAKATTPRFMDWLTDGFDGIVRQVAGATASREEALWVLNDLLWKAHAYLSQCLEFQMQAVLEHLPSLSGHERRLFTLWFSPQPWLGDVSPLVLHKRLGYLPSALSDLEHADPQDTRPWRALLQSLYWHSEMVQARREADLARKHRSRERWIVSTSPRRGRGSRG